MLSSCSKTLAAAATTAAATTTPSMTSTTSTPTSLQQVCAAKVRARYEIISHQHKGGRLDFLLFTLDARVVEGHKAVI
jgi:hypothetical protein